MIHTGRKDREDPSLYNSKGSFGKINQLKQPPSMSPNTTSCSSRFIEPAVQSPVQSSRILAGYMANEFLTRGTLFGQKFDPARAEAVPLAAAEPKRKLSHTCPEQPKSKRPKLEPNQSYTEVAQLLKGDGAHIPGVVNPTQLSRWIQM